MSALFISYASDDQAVALEACALLEAQGIRCWIAPRDVSPGAQWDEAIVDAITSAGAFLLILTTSANGSPYVKNEVNHAFAAKKPIFTFRVEDVQPSKSLGFYLARNHWTDGFPAPIEPKLARLAAAVTTVLGAEGIGVGVPTAGAPTMAKRLRAAIKGTLKGGRRMAPMTAAVVLPALAVGLATWMVMRPPPSRPVQMTISHPGAESVGGNAFDANIAIAPDGRHVAYIASGASGNDNTLRLYLRALDRREPTLLSSSARSPFFSPDGQWVGFVEENNRLSKVALTGGASTPISGIGVAGVRGASWGSDDAIVFATSDRSTGLIRIAAAGGEAEVLTKADTTKGELDHLFPEVLPGARAVLFTIETSQGIGNSQIALLDLETRTWRVLIQGGTHARYVAPGHLLYGASGALRAVAFDIDRLEVSGASVPVLNGVATKASGAASFSVARSGTLIYIGGEDTGNLTSMAWVDRTGREDPLGIEPRLFDGSSFAVSPDGTRIAVSVLANDGTARDIWIGSLARRTLTRLTFDNGGLQTRPRWTSDGTRIVYRSAPRPAAGGAEPVQAGLYWRLADGTGDAELLLRQGGSSPVSLISPGSWSADGRLLFHELTLRGNSDIGVLQVTGTRAATPVLANPSYSESFPELSRDGRWLAYQSDESGQDEIYVRPFPGVDSGKWQVSSGGGLRPRWSADGRTLFYRDGRRNVLMAASIQTAPGFAASTPVPAIMGGTSDGVGEQWDVSPDGTRFLIVKGIESPERPELGIVLNWVDELKRLVPAK
jgi:serine/threonine-protein kinase